MFSELSPEERAVKIKVDLVLQLLNADPFIASAFDVSRVKEFATLENTVMLTLACYSREHLGTNGQRRRYILEVPLSRSWVADKGVTIGQIVDEIKANIRQAEDTGPKEVRIGMETRDDRVQ